MGGWADEGGGGGLKWGRIRGRGGGGQTGGGGRQKFA